VLGIVHAGDLFEQAIRGQAISSVDIERAVKPPLYVPESVSAMGLLEALKKHRTELALVVSEYGEIEGMVTLSDVMGALVGDVSVIDDDEHEADAVQREDGSWLIDGGVSLDRFRDIMESGVRFPEEANGTYHTLAGFILTQLGHIPEAAEHFEWDEFRFEVMDMDRQRIDRLLVSRIPKAETPAVDEPQ
jgi:putative hemolysin